jgi:23S rRNA G2069 N7-methylase RlmK/C1962 C5-methylase RlmI
VSDKKSPIILFSDERWLVVDKPYGIATHGGDAGDVGVQEWLNLHLNEKTFVCSRLDIGTTGVLLFAKTPAASALAEQIHTDGKAEKVYYFLADKDVRKTRGAQWTCDEPLDDKHALTQFYFEKQLAKQVYLYRAVIARGRKHQIRRHAALSGCPLSGDTEYGGVPAPRIALHCAELRWPELPSVICSKLPEYFNPDAHVFGNTFLECLTALDRRGEWIRSISNAWRVIQRGELREFDLSVDVYGSHALVWVYDETDFDILSRELSLLLDRLKKRFAVAGCVYRRIGKNPHKKGLVQDLSMTGEKPDEQFSVFEHEWQATVTLNLRQHVGLFLDHRDNRRRVQKMAQGKRVANLFSYTCAFGVSAAKAGCEVVMNVDASAGTLNLGKQNFELNDLTRRRSGKFIEKDVRLWLEKQVEKRISGTDGGWDIIICDPPTFSSTQAGGTFHVSREWAELAAACAQILRDDGCCFFSTNCQADERSGFEGVLRRFFESVQRLRPPLDFPEVAGRSHAHFFECRRPIHQSRL